MNPFGCRVEGLRGVKETGSPEFYRTACWGIGEGLSQGSGQSFDGDISEGDGISVAGEAEESGAAIFTGVWSVAHIFGDFGDVSGEDDVAVKFDANVGAVDGDFLEVPCSGRTEEAAFGGGDTVD